MSGYLNEPVLTLKEALPLKELLATHKTEFEIQPNEDEEEDNDETSAESCFKFEDIQQLVNLNMIEVEDGEDGTPFDRYRRKMFNLREDGKIKKFVVKRGVGPVVPKTSVAYVRYQAYIEYQELPFDSTLYQNGGERDIPVPLTLSKCEMILGMQQSLLSMQRGEISEFLIHPDLAYGKLGCAPRIPQNATVLFIVEMDRFIDCGDAVVEDEENLSGYERRAFPLALKEAKKNTLLANDLFKQGDYRQAANKYRLAINQMHNARLADDKEEEERNHFMIKNYSNVCICYKKMGKHKLICSMANEAIKVDEKKVYKNYKLLYHWGYAKMVLGDFASAKRHLLKAQTLHPTDTMISQALKELVQKQADYRQEERMMMMRAFGNSTSSATKQEVDKEEDQFRKVVREELERFLNNSKKYDMYIKDQELTRQEERVYLDEAKALGLYARVVDDEKERFLHIKKAEST